MCPKAEYLNETVKNNNKENVYYSLLSRVETLFREYFLLFASHLHKKFVSVEKFLFNKHQIWSLLNSPFEN